ncbi:MAG: hypothetical protein FWE62_00980 [Firmicutes bacterium]|nr:hypothetical protein [Bacillota bacterium]
MGKFFRDIDDIFLINSGFLLYNFIAFALQAPLDYLVDRVRLSHLYFSIIGCLLVTFGLILPISPWAKLILCAGGNALFHIGGRINGRSAEQ